MSVLLIGTLDTKGDEVRFVRDLLRGEGVAAVVLDAGVLGPPAFAADIDRERVFRAAGTTLDELRRRGDRGMAVEAAARGAAALARELDAAGGLEGVLGLGGSEGTTIATAAMRAVPFGVPKVMVSTLASGQVRPYVGVRDILMFHSVADISGLNRVTRSVLARAALAVAGMVRGAEMLRSWEGTDAPLVGATMFGVTTPCVEAARRQIEAAGYEVLVFHATGTGGQTLEAF